MQSPKDELQIARAMIEDLRDMNQVLTAFIRPQQLPNVLILGSWLGAAVYFINDDGYLF